MFAEFRFAARTLARWRGRLAVAIATLALGVGAITVLYALAHAIAADLTGVTAPDRVGRLYAASAGLGVDRAPVALNEFDETLSNAASFASIGAYAEAEVTLGSSGTARRVLAGFASPAVFRVLGVAPAVGRVFTAADTASPRAVALVSERFWRERYAGRDLDTAFVSVNGIERAVVGVMPAHFAYGVLGISADVWIPLARASRDAPMIVSVFGRLRPDVEWPAAAAELDALPVHMAQWRWRAIPIEQDSRRRAAAAYGVAVGPGLIVLLLACANVGSMLLAGGLRRERELTIRRALGATRARLTRQLLIEHGLLASIGGALGFIAAAAVLEGIAGAIGASDPALASRLAADPALLPFALAASLLACAVFGVLPALRLSRRDVAASLKGLPAPRRIDIAGYGPRDVIVFVEVVAAAGLTVFAAMSINLFRATHLVRPAFAADHVVAMRVPAIGILDVVARLSTTPGVDSVTFASGMLGARGGASAVQARGAGGGAGAMSRVPVGDRFLETLGIPLVRGRSFEQSELLGGAQVTVISQSAARTLFPATDPVGKRLHLSGRASVSVVVIGVCRDAVDYGALARAGLAPPDVYVPYDATTLEAVVLARVSGDAHSLLPAVAAAAQTQAGHLRPKPLVVADEPAFVHSGDSLVLLRIVSGVALMALLLAATGIFGVVGHSVAQRTREFGIRLVLGSTARGVLTLVAAREAKLICPALIAGAAATLALTRVLVPELAALSTTAPSVWVAVVGLCGGTASLAWLMAAWGIVRLDFSAVLHRP